MSTNYHTALVDGSPSNLNANAATLNVPLGELDAQISTNANNISGMLAGTTYFTKVASEASSFRIETSSSGETLILIDAIPGDGTSVSRTRYGRNVNTTGDVVCTWFLGDGTSSSMARIARDSASYICNGTGQNFGVGTNNPQTLLHVAGAIEIDGALNHDGSGIGFFGTTPTTQKTVTGSRGGNAALASLLTQLAAYGLIVDSSS